MTRLFRAGVLALVAMLPLAGGSGAAPHQSDKIHWEAMLFCQIVLDGHAAHCAHALPGSEGRGRLLRQRSTACAVGSNGEGAASAAPFSPEV
jgi:hypothetical protein